MVAWMNEASYLKTLETAETWFWSRSRSELWNKGATSGNRQQVKAISVDCDRDTLLIAVDPSGPSCHTGAESCFGETTQSVEGLRSLETLHALLKDRRAQMPEGSYSTYLFNAGRDKILKKVGEEATEVVIAAKGTDPERLVSEVADLLYHLSVLLVDADISLESVDEELRKRSSGKGVEEKH